MNICILCRNIHKDLGGIETFAREYSYALAIEGHTVHIIAQDRGHFYREAIHPNITVHDIFLKDKPFYGFWFMDSFFPIEEMYFGFMALREIRKISKTIKIDIVEAMDYFRKALVWPLTGSTPYFYVCMAGCSISRGIGPLMKSRFH
jgi:hypothetical protein